MDLRDYIRKCEEEGELKGLKQRWTGSRDLSHCKLVEEKSGPALLFENVKGYKSPVLTGALARPKAGDYPWEEPQSVDGPAYEGMG